MSNIQLRARLDAGIHPACSAYEWEPHAVPTLDLALLELPLYAMLLRGSYGNIGCGDAGNIYVQDDTGLWIAELDEDDCTIAGWVLVDEDGNTFSTQPNHGPEIREDSANPSYADVIDAAGPDWDGNNHVGGNAADYMRACGVDHVDGDVFRLIRDGDMVFAEPLDGWVELAYYGDPANDLPDGVGDLNELQRILDGAGVVYQTCDLTYYDEDGISTPCIWLAIRTEDAATAGRAITAATANG
jgi:hypothetical protein